MLPTHVRPLANGCLLRCVRMSALLTAVNRSLSITRPKIIVWHCFVVNVIYRCDLSMLFGGGPTVRSHATTKVSGIHVVYRMPMWPSGRICDCQAEDTGFEPRTDHVLRSSFFHSHINFTLKGNFDY
jgi:hypothetical protein